METGVHYPLRLDALPSGWRAGYVGDFTKNIEPGFASGEHNQTGEGVAHLRPMNIDREGKIDLSVRKFVSPNKDNRRLAVGDVLFNNTNSPELVGKTATVNVTGNFAFSNHMTRISFVDNVLPKFGALQLHFLWMRGYFKYNCVKHVNQASVSSRMLARSVPFVWAPPVEQERIVAELEKQFSRLDEAGATLTRAIVAMSAYRASVLETAIRGQLVRESGPTSPLRLGDLIGQIHQGWSPKCDLQRVPGPDEWAVITTTAVQPMKYVDNQGKPLPAALVPRPRLEIQPGDFLVTRKGPRARAGVACLVRQTRRRLMVCDTVYRFRCDESKVVPDYLEIALNAPSVVQAIDRQKAGINESGVSLTHQKLGGIAIPVPSREAQHRIVAEVDLRLSIVREVETEVDANLKRSQALRSAVLASAFRVQ